MKLFGKILIRGTIETLTGMHIGGSKSSLNIGGIDNSVIKTVKGIPYIPGSSLKGKLRSLLAKKERSLFFSNKEKDDFLLNQDTNEEIYKYFNGFKTDEDPSNNYIVELFGFSGDADTKNLEKVNYTRLYVRDAQLINSDDKLLFAEDFTQSKFENVINRRTGTAENPRQMERVPVGAKFGFEIVYNLYDDLQEDQLANQLNHLVLALKLVEDDFIGGQGSRGYGQVDISIDMERTVLKYINEDKYEDTNWEFENKTELNKKLIAFRDALKTI